LSAAGVWDLSREKNFSQPQLLGSYALTLEKKFSAARFSKNVF
jgi:hypothetical protein